MKKVAAVVVIVFATTVTCLAGPSPSACTSAAAVGCTKAPEIDMNSIGTASALVGCMVFMLRRRRKSQQ
jgi:hypothetical protein